MSAALGKRSNRERADERLMAAYWSGRATEEQIADVADLLLSNYDRQRKACEDYLDAAEADTNERLGDRGYWR
jgi:hypothetical protein